jgi:hypothetical protein
MKKLLTFTALLSLVAISCNAQWVRPNTFTEDTAPTNATFEVYSQKNGLPRRASLDNLKKFFDQRIYTSGDSLCITRTVGDTCIYLPAGTSAGADYDVWALRSSGASYLLSADTVDKYNYMYIQYEAITTPSGSTITLPNVTASMIGKVVEVSVFYTGASGLSSASIAGPLTIVNGTSVTYPSSYTATTGTYKFVATLAIDQVATYRWQLLSTGGSGSSSSKRVNVSQATSTTITLTSGDFTSTDIWHFYANASSGNSGVVLPNPSADLVGKTVFFYPFATAPNTNSINASSLFLIKFTGPNTFTSASSVTISRPIAIVCIPAPIGFSGYYWAWDYLDPLDEIQTLTFTNDTLSISGGNSVYIPSGDSVLLGNIQDISTNRLLGRYTAGTGPVEQLTIGSDFSTAGGTLALASASATGYSFHIATLAGGGRVIVTYFGAAPSVSGSTGNYTITFPASCRPISFTVNGGAGDLTGGGALNITCTWTSLPSSLNTSELLMVIPAITITETTTASNIQLSNQGTGYQITHPTISAGSTTTTITGVSGIGSYSIKGVF